MKVRTPKSRKKAFERTALGDAFKSSNPLKFDPTRTITLRRAFSQRLKKQFSLLKGRIIKTVLQDNDFGLIANVFCATGSGGGVDPSCARDESGGGHSDSKGTDESKLKDIQAQLQSVVRRLNKMDPRGEGETNETLMVDLKKLNKQKDAIMNKIAASVAKESGFKTGEEVPANKLKFGMSVEHTGKYTIIEVSPRDIRGTVKKGSETETWDANSQKALAHYREEVRQGKEEVHTDARTGSVVGPANADIEIHRGKVASKKIILGDGSHRFAAAVLEGKKKIKVKVPVYRVRGKIDNSVSNRFCATGVGGGVDPSCSPSDKEDGGDSGEDIHAARGKESTKEDYSEPSPTLRPGETKLPWKMAFPESEEMGGYGKGRGAEFEAAVDKWIEAGRPGGLQDTQIPLGKDDILVGQAGYRKRIAQAKADGDLPMSDIEGYKFKGKFYIDNGHHSLMAYKLRGEKTAPGKIVDLDAVHNVSNRFCATGAGGGVDPSCGADSGTSSGGGGSDAHIEAKASESRVSRLFNAVKGLATKAQEAYHKVALKLHVAELAPDLFDTVEDCQRIYYAGGKSVPHPLAALGIPLSAGQLTVISSHVLAKAYLLARKAITGNEELLLLNVLSLDDQVDLIKSIFDAMHEAIPELGTPPTREWILEYVKDHQGAVANLSSSFLQGNAERYADASNAERIKAFQKWLEEQLQTLVTGKTQEELWDKYIEDGFRKGAGRAFDDVRAAERSLSTTDEALDFYRGTREQFLRSAFGQKESQDKVELLASRAFDDLDNVTSDMSVKMSRALTDGLVQGKSPREVAGDLTDVVDISFGRAETIARTELIRAHAEGQLEAMDQLGVTEVGVAVEWVTAGDERVCDECAPLEGIVLSLDEARGMLPRHPNCRCAWVPANVGEDEEDQQRSQAAIKSALKESSDEGDDEEWGPNQGISRGRPRSILNERRRGGPSRSRRLSRIDEYLSRNSFCPTGAGGGVDATCSPSQGGGGGVRQDVLTASKVVGAGIKAAVVGGRITREQGGRYARTLGRVLNRMTPEATQRIAAHVKGDTVWSADLKGVKDGLVDQLRAEGNPGTADTISKWAIVAGCYLSNKDRTGGNLHLDGGKTGDKLGDMMEQEGIYAHELTHAIDGPKHEHSKTDAWKVAFQQELEGGKLTKYAASKPSEGFAEFGRLLYSGAKTTDEVKTAFPKCYAFFESKGLVEKSKTTANEQFSPPPSEESFLPELFSQSVDLGDRGHLDLPL